MGCATAYSLAGRGHQVTLYEQFEIGHKRGSSHGETRIYRYSYPDARYVAMMKEALPLWRDFERTTGLELLTQTGGLDTGASLAQHAAALESCDITFEMIDGRSANQRWPVVSFDDDAEVLYQSEGGIVHADRAWRAFGDAARDLGAEIRSGQRVGALELDDGVRVISEEVETYDAAVVTAGGWAPGLLAGCGIDLPTRVTRETVAFFRFSEVPPTVVDWGDPAVYALADPGRGIKAGEHIAGPTTDADAPGEVNRDSVARLTEWVARRYPGAPPEPWHAETCIYTNTDDQHFLIERHGPLVVGSPCSGHGFKFAPLIGRRLTALVEEI